MKKHLKIIIPIVLGIAGIIVVYQFVIVSREEAKKLESARQDAFFKCDKRFDVVMQQIKGLPQSMLDDIMLDINFTLAYMSKVDMNGVFKIIDFLKSQGCDMALQKLQARMSADIEAGISPGSQP